MMSEPSVRHQGGPEIFPLSAADRSPPQLEDDIIDVSHLARIWLVWSWFPILVALGCAYFGYQRLMAFTPQAQATMIILPSGQAPTQAPGGAITGLASQLGVQLVTAPTSVSPVERLKLLLGSIDLAARLQEKYLLLQRIYPSLWDSATGTWKVPDSADFHRDQARAAFLKRNLWTAPTLESLAGYVGGSVRFEQLGTTGFQRVSVSHADPDFALWLLSTAFLEADSLLREKDRAQTTERQQYIERQLVLRPMLQVQEALRAQLSAEISRSITLEADLTPYVASIVEAPHVLRNRTEPNVLILFGGPMVIGASAGFALVTLLALIRRERRRS